MKSLPLRFLTFKERRDTMKTSFIFGLILSLATATSFAAKPEKNIVETAVGADNFNTLVAAVKAADLADALQADGPLTVFAPTDEAFAKLPEGTVESLLLPENKEKLISILKYHVVAGAVTSGDVVKLKSATTLNGHDVKINSCNGVKINNAKVVTADIHASNGVIHVIDTVLLP